MSLSASAASVLRGLQDLSAGSWRERTATLRQLSQLVRLGVKHREVLVPFYELFTGNAAHLLDRFFESEILKTTLATDAVIGALVSPKDAGSAYVLLHHVMGQAAGAEGVWAYVEGGMGAISNAIAASARAAGAEIAVNASVDAITYQRASQRTGAVFCFSVIWCCEMLCAAV